MIEKKARKFLRRMISTNGFIAYGLYSEDVSPRFWQSNNQCSARMIDINLFLYLKRERLIIKNKDGRYLISEKGIQFAKPWYQRWFALEETSNA